MPKASTSKLLDGEKKPSQRPSWSCTACTKKKIKCQKIIPCAQCISRGKRADCHLAEADPDLPQRDPLQNPHRETRLATEAEFDALRESVVAIRQRLFHLETALSSFAPQFAQDGAKLYMYQGNGIKAETEAPGSSVEGYPSEEPETELLLDADGDVEAAVTLEFLALGRDRKEEHFSRGVVRKLLDDEEPQHGNPPPGVSPSTLDPSLSTPGQFAADIAISSPVAPVAASPTDSLPEKERSDQIIRFSLEFALWQHSAVHPDVFLAECAEFHGWEENRGNLVNQAWLALYYSVLCTGVKHMRPSDALDCGISPEELKSLPRQYYDSSIASLHRANFLAKHSVFTVQAIVVLNHACLDIGGSDYSATLLSCGIRIGQHLGLHRFSSDEDWENRRLKNGVDPLSPAGINGLIVREIRKRLWAAMSTDDWFGAAYRRPYAITPTHCTTPPPVNCHDSDLAKGLLVARPMDEPTVVSKLILTMRVAACVRRFFEDVSAAGSMTADLCRQVDSDIRSITLTGPTFIQPDANLDHLPPFAAWLRRYFIISTEHKLLVIHRTLVGRSLKGSEYAFSRTAMTEAARTILDKFVDAPLDFQHVWTLPYHAIVASTTVILELFQNPSSNISEKRALVERALQRLSTMEDYSTIASRGVQLIGTLLAEEAARRSGSSSANGRKRSASHLPDVDSLAKRMHISSTTSSPALGSSFLPSDATDTPPSSAFLAHRVLGAGGLSIMADPATPVDDSMTFLNSSLTQDSQDALDWLLTNPQEAAWQNGGGDGDGDPGVFANDSSLDFWRLLEGFDGQGTAEGLDSM